MKSSKSSDRACPLMLSPHPAPSTQHMEKGEGVEVTALRKKTATRELQLPSKVGLPPETSNSKSTYSCCPGGTESRRPHPAGGSRSAEPRGQWLECRKSSPGQEPWPGHPPAGCGFWGPWRGSRLPWPPSAVQRSITGPRDNCAARCVSQVREEPLPGVWGEGQWRAHLSSSKERNPVPP